MARWLLAHSIYAVTATMAPNTMSGTPSKCRPAGTPGNGGSSWTIPSPATTRASAVRLQARKVRSFANVNRGSGSVPSSSGSGSGESATPAPPPLPLIAGEIFPKRRWPPQAAPLIRWGAGWGPRPQGCRDLVTREQQVPAPIWLLARMRISWRDRAPWTVRINDCDLRRPRRSGPAGRPRRSRPGTSGRSSQLNHQAVAARTGRLPHSPGVRRERGSQSRTSTQPQSHRAARYLPSTAAMNPSGSTRLMVSELTLLLRNSVLGWRGV